MARINQENYLKLKY